MANARIGKESTTATTRILVALIVATSGIVIALIGIIPKIEFNSPGTVLGTGRLVGSVTDRSGTPITKITVSVQNGAQTETDMDGNFVLNAVPAGDQILLMKSPSNHGSLTQNISIETNKTTRTKVVYDATTSSLGILSITNPVDGGILEVRSDGTNYWALIQGRCDGLSQILQSFDVWVLVSSEKDTLLWIQQPSAVVDRNRNSWRARIGLGSSAHPPVEGESWNIVAVAAKSELDLGSAKNTPRLTFLPAHLSSNVVTVQLANIKTRPSEKL